MCIEDCYAIGFIHSPDFMVSRGTIISDYNPQMLISGVAPVELSWSISHNGRTLLYLRKHFRSLSEIRSDKIKELGIK